QSDDIVGLLNAVPIFQGSPIFTRLTDLDNAYNQNSFIQEISVRELIIMLDEPGHNGILPVVSLNEDTWQTEEGPQQMIEIEGVTSVKANQFQGSLLGEDIMGLRWMQDESERNNLTIEKDGETVSELVIVNPNADVTIKTEEEEATFHVNITAMGMINVMNEDLEEETIIEEAQKKIKE